jgi:hypothetical protein
MPSMTLVTPVEIVGVKNTGDIRINPARKEDVDALPLAELEMIALRLAEISQMLQLLRTLGVADAATSRLRVIAEVITGSTTAITGAIATAIGTVRVEEAGGFGLRNITEAAELRRETMDVGFGVQRSSLNFS